MSTSTQSTHPSTPPLPKPSRPRPSASSAEGQVSAIVGYAAARRKGSAQPIIISHADDAAKLIFTPACVNNLAVYLTKAKKEIPKTARSASWSRDAT